MKSVGLLSILSAFVFALSLTAAADSKQSGKITIHNPVVVSGAQLHPGDYVVRWSGTGPDMEVRFLHDGDEVASLTGTVLQRENEQQSITTVLGEGGTRVLSEIALSRVTLMLAPPVTPIAD
jgi:hypothetical protein